METQLSDDEEDEEDGDPLDVRKEMAGEKVMEFVNAKLVILRNEKLDGDGILIRDLFAMALAILAFCHGRCTLNSPYVGGRVYMYSNERMVVAIATMAVARAAMIAFRSRR